MCRTFYFDDLILKKRDGDDIQLNVNTCIYKAKFVYVCKLFMFVRITDWFKFVIVNK